MRVCLKEWAQNKQIPEDPRPLRVLDIVNFYLMICQGVSKIGPKIGWENRWGFEWNATSTLLKEYVDLVISSKGAISLKKTTEGRDKETIYGDLGLFAEHDKKAQLDDFSPMWAYGKREEKKIAKLSIFPESHKIFNDPRNFPSNPSPILGFMQIFHHVHTSSHPKIDPSHGSLLHFIQLAQKKTITKHPFFPIL